jgi:transcriptional regulator with XRE-family HTH domain
MEMQLDSKRIRAEREKRAWSQEHLATVAELSLRTIQRVETAGTASFETARAIAVVLEIDVAELRVAEVAPRAPRSGKLGWMSAAAALVLAVSAFLARDAFAGQVMLDVGLSLNDQQLGKHQLITEEGKDAEIRLEGQIRLIVAPTVTPDGTIALSIRMYEFAGGQFVLVSEPRLLAADNQKVELALTSRGGNVFRIAINPHKI